MNVWLVNVNDQNFFRLMPGASDPANRPASRVRIMGFPPLGIQTLAAVLSERGHEIRMFDTCHPEMTADHIVAASAAGPPDVLAISFLSATTYPEVKTLAGRFKDSAPGTPIIVGGPFASINAVRIVRDCPEIDGVGVGEGEELLPDYLNNLSDPAAVSGLVWRYGDEVIQNPARPLIDDLDRYPCPDRQSLPIDFIESLPLDVPAVLSLDKFCTMQTSRGCPFSCIYCDIPTLSQRKWRARSPEHVLEEMQRLHDQGYRSIYLTDDHFLLHSERVQKICEGIIRRKLAFHWGGEGRVDSAAVSQLKLLQQAGCKKLAFGIEAGMQKVLDRLGKRQTLEQVERAVGEAKKQGIERLHGFFVIGSPGETEADIMASFRFAARLPLDTFSFNRLSVYRGTPLWNEYVDGGIIDDDRDWYKWFKCSDLDPTALPGKVVNRARMKGYSLLFAHRLVFRPMRTFRLLRSFARHMSLADILRLLLSPFRRREMTRKPDLL
ncbi:MAG: radical SAM protein [Acidobacteria bacterium]|nr:MAG: radical SAM protein [Acidobacteriota bacterium]